MKIYKTVFPHVDQEGYTTITPELAQQCLANNTENRSMRKKFVSALARKILDGQWEPNTTDHIGFYEDGVLANGQHRLAAIVKAGIAVKTKIDYNIPKRAAICIDTGKSRSFSDNVQIITGEGYYTSKISKMISLAYMNGKSMSHEDHLEIATNMKKQILDIKCLFEGYSKYFTTSEIMAAAFMAYTNGVEYDTLSNFVRILGTGRASDEVSETVLKLRDKILSEVLSSTSSRRNSSEQVKRVQNVIYNYAKGKILERITYPNEYRYPQLRLFKSTELLD